jgi:hypothetical protein
LEKMALPGNPLKHLSAVRSDVRALSCFTVGHHVAGYIKSAACDLGRMKNQREARPSGQWEFFTRQR